MTDWATIAQIATAGGTLVLALATFSSIKSANRSARVAERSLLAGVRPVLIPSREDDPPERVRFGDGEERTLSGHGATFWVPQDGPNSGRIYLAIALRNGGSGRAVIHGWRVEVEAQTAVADAPDPEQFRRQLRDLYIPAGDTGFWQGAIRDPEDPDYRALRSCFGGEERDRVLIDVLYGDYEGGQRAIARFSISEWGGVDGERADVLRYWNVDGENPR
jgi:hypothetical protein